jgi:hypothetical protein
MNFYDLHSQITVKPLINPAATPADNTPIVSAIIDRKDYEGVELVVNCGSIPDADVTYAALLEEGDAANLSDAAAVAAAPGLVGALPAIQFDSDNKTFNFGYQGSKRYVRLTLTPSNNSGASLLGGVAILYRGRFSGKQIGTGSYPSTEGNPVGN